MSSPSTSTSSSTSTSQTKIRRTLTAGDSNKPSPHPDKRPATAPSSIITATATATTTDRAFSKCDGDGAGEDVVSRYGRHSFTPRSPRTDGREGGDGDEVELEANAVVGSKDFVMDEVLDEGKGGAWQGLERGRRERDSGSPPNVRGLPELYSEPSTSKTTTTRTRRAATTTTTTSSSSSCPSSSSNFIDLVTFLKTPTIPIPQSTSPEFNRDRNLIWPISDEPPPPPSTGARRTMTTGGGRGKKAATAGRISRKVVGGGLRLNRSNSSNGSPAVTTTLARFSPPLMNLRKRGEDGSENYFSGYGSGSGDRMAVSMSTSTSSDSGGAFVVGGGVGGGEFDLPDLDVVLSRIGLADHLEEFQGAGGFGGLRSGDGDGVLTANGVGNGVDGGSGDPGGGDRVAFIPSKYSDLIKILREGPPEMPASVQDARKSTSSSALRDRRSEEGEEIVTRERSGSSRKGKERQRQGPNESADVGNSEDEDILSILRNGPSSPLTLSAAATTASRPPPPQVRGGPVRSSSETSMSSLSVSGSIHLISEHPSGRIRSMSTESYLTSFKRSQAPPQHQGNPSSSGTETVDRPSTRLFRQGFTRQASSSGKESSSPSFVTRQSSTVPLLGGGGRKKESVSSLATTADTVDTSESLGEVLNGGMTTLSQRQDVVPSEFPTGTNSSVAMVAHRQVSQMTLDSWEDSTDFHGPREDDRNQGQDHDPHDQIKGPDLLTGTSYGHLDLTDAFDAEYRKVTKSARPLSRVQPFPGGQTYSTISERGLSPPSAHPPSLSSFNPTSPTSSPEGSPLTSPNLRQASAILQSNDRTTVSGGFKRYANPFLPTRQRILARRDGVSLQLVEEMIGALDDLEAFWSSSDLEQCGIGIDGPDPDGRGCPGSSELEERQHELLCELDSLVSEMIELVPEFMTSLHRGLYQIPFLFNLDENKGIRLKRDLEEAFTRGSYLSRNHSGSSMGAEYHDWSALAATATTLKEKKSDSSGTASDDMSTPGEPDAVDCPLAGGGLGISGLAEAPSEVMVGVGVGMVGLGMEKREDELLKEGLRRWKIFQEGRKREMSQESVRQPESLLIR